MPDYLSVHRLEKRFSSHGRAAIHNLTFSVEQDAFVALIGPSGCGKSTLLHIMAGLSEPSAGVARPHPALRCGPRAHCDPIAAPS